MNTTAKMYVPKKLSPTQFKKILSLNKDTTKKPPQKKRKVPVKKKLVKQVKKPIKVTKKEASILARQQRKKKMLLDKFHKVPVVYAAASQCGVDKSTYYRWRREDRGFAKAADIALEEGTLFTNDMVESLLLKKAKEENMTAIIFWLKNNSDNYGEHREYVHTHKIEGADILTPERKQEILVALRAWEAEDDDGGDDAFLTKKGSID